MKRIKHVLLLSAAVIVIPLALANCDAKKATVNPPANAEEVKKTEHPAKTTEHPKKAEHPEKKAEHPEHPKK